MDMNPKTCEHSSDFLCPGCLCCSICECTPRGFTCNTKTRQGTDINIELTETYADRYIRNRIETLEEENARLGEALTKTMLVLIEAIKKTHPSDGMALVKDITKETIAAIGKSNS